MPRDFTFRKRSIIVVMTVLIAADIALGVYSWDLAAAPQTPQSAFDQQNLRLKVLRGDVKSAESIKDNMPTTRADCDKFEHALPSASVGYSMVTSELDDLAKKSGLEIVSLTNKQKEITDRGLIEASLGLTVNGDYNGVMRFVNSLQRSQSFYIVESLALAAEAQTHAPAGGIKVALSLRTYFRESE